MTYTYSQLRNDPTILKNLTSRDKVPLVCENCHTVYMQPKNYVQGKLKKGRKNGFCSPECSNKHLKKLADKNCKTCEVGFSPRYTNQKFCSQSCAATHNNVITPKRSKTRICQYCGGKTSNPKYCSKSCQGKQRRELTIAQFRNGELADTRNLRTVLIELYGHRCEKCKRTTWNDLPIPLELDHIDGDHKNNSPDNVRLLCPNCHAQTDTYKGKNKGKGRAWRMERYHAGLSY